MKRFMYTTAGALALLLMIGLVPVLSQDGMGGGDDGAAEEEDMGAKWMKLNQPGKQHKEMAESVGQWEITGTMFEAQPDGTMKETALKGSSTIKMMWDRYLQEEMSIEGAEMPMKMIGYIGYDNSAQEYKAMYIGNMGTGMHVFSGGMSEDGKTMTLSGEWTEKGLDNMKVKERVVSTSKSADEQVMQIFGKYGEWPEMKLMEVTYKRKK